MKNTDYHGITMVLLGGTIPLCVVVIFLNRVLAGAPMSEQAAGVINTITTTIGGGLIAILAYKYGKRQETKDEKPE
jgi:uncharacterized membrane-anchored protein